MIPNIVYPTKTNGSGIYAIPSLPPGRYRLVVRKDGFKGIDKTDITLNVQDILEQNFSLEIGSTSETVTVSGAGNNINTTDASVSTVVDRQFVENIPLNGRSFQTLIMLTPGTVLSTASGSQGQFSISGQRGDSNYVTVDGASADIGATAYRGIGQYGTGSIPGATVQGGTSALVSVDAMEEFRIQTSSFAPEFGRSPGGQISIATRSGSNQFHGTLFDYFRNDALDANNWFADNSGLRKPAERQNDFGGVVGGPIIRDKTFFFFSYEGLRLRQPLTSTVTVPSLASRQAAVSQIQPFLNAYPVPNGVVQTNGTAKFAASYSNPSTEDVYSIRVDHTINSRLTLFGRYSNAPSTAVSRLSTMLSVTNPLNVNTQTATAGLTLIASPSISNEQIGRAHV